MSDDLLMPFYALYVRDEKGQVHGRLARNSVLKSDRNRVPYACVRCRV